MLVVLGIMLLAGVVGGYVGTLVGSGQVDGQADKRSKGVCVAWGGIARGVAASFLVPLFLKMASSRLLTEVLEKSAGNRADGSGLLVLFSFCLAASLSGQNFIDTVGKRALAIASEASSRVKNVSKELDAYIISETEPENQAQIKIDVDQEEQKVLDAFGKSHFKRRSMSGITKELQVDKTETNRYLDCLEQKGIIRRTASKNDDKPRWELTETGRAVISRTVVPKDSK